MIAETGQFTLVLALIVAIVQGTLPLAGSVKNNIRLMALGSTSATSLFLCVLVSFGCLIQAFIVSDFSVFNVAQNSHTQKPLLYKISGVWGNHEGSMLLWVTILTLFGASVAAFGKNLPESLKARVLSIQGLISASFISFILFTSNPFLRLDPAPVEGQGLNPILQDPGLAFHPPFLYIGYVGFSIVFSFAVAALIEGRIDPAWARWVRPWTLAAWCSLTIGIALGSWWAYYELGWGGWWFWDPVENASLIPWLIGTALLHSAIVVEKRDALKSWTILLAILTFSMSLLGTFLVRSGILTSVHTFATDPERGVFILLLLILISGSALILYALRASLILPGGVFSPISREAALIFNNLLLTTGAAVVLLGTLYPLLLDALYGAKVSVGPPFYNATFLPIMAPVLVACVIGSMLRWKRADLAGVLGRLKVATLTALLVVLTIIWATGSGDVLVALALGVSAWIIIGTMVQVSERINLFKFPLSKSLSRARNLPRAFWGMVISHSALGILVIGITISSAWRVEFIKLMKAGDTVSAGGYTLTFAGTLPIVGPNYTGIQGQFRVERNGKEITVLLPEKRSYPAERNRTTEAGILSTISGDLYTVLGEMSENGEWSTRIYFNPMINWIWIGAILMAFGGLISLTDRRLHIRLLEKFSKEANGNAA
ncbi:MAG: heme lyase NrfEFG subunit NrfE [Rhodospirillaceae bacterium]|nr:heme lyase NrfEFG subunit NrfE [Rhodospirillaceae bacterium]